MPISESWVQQAVLIPVILFLKYHTYHTYIISLLNANYNHIIINATCIKDSLCCLHMMGKIRNSGSFKSKEILEIWGKLYITKITLSPIYQFYIKMWFFCLLFCYGICLFVCFNLQVKLTWWAKEVEETSWVHERKKTRNEKYTSDTIQKISTLLYEVTLTIVSFY